jgi:hypothetical protein
VIPVCYSLAYHWADEPSEAAAPPADLPPPGNGHAPHIPLPRAEATA